MIKISNIYDSFYASWSDLVSLRSSGFNHLWTIAPEIKYYCLVPLICYLFSKLNDFWFFGWLGSVFSVVYYEIHINDMYDHNGDIFLKTVHDLWIVISMFFAGSLMAMFYFNIEKRPHLLEKFKGAKTQGVISISCVFMFPYGFRIFSYMWQSENSKFFQSNVKVLSSVYWSFFVFLMLVGAPNYITNIFNISFLKKCGKYSFGMYLFHPACLQLVHCLYPFIPRCTKRDLKTDVEVLVAVVFLSYFVGYLFFNFIENNLINLANVLCKKVENIRLFSNKQDDI